jgi:hypothetical protein
MSEKNVKRRNILTEPSLPSTNTDTSSSRMPRLARRLSVTQEPKSSQTEDNAMIIYEPVGDAALTYMKYGRIPQCDEQAELYIRNCERFNIHVDAGVVIALRTG